MRSTVMNKQKGLQRKFNSALTSLALAVMTPFFNPAYADINSLLFSKTGERLDLVKFEYSDRDLTLYVDNNFKLNQNYVVVYGEASAPFKTPKNNFAHLEVFKIYYDCRRGLHKLADFEYYQFDTVPDDLGWKLVEFYEGGGSDAFSPIQANTPTAEVADWFCHRY